METPNVEVGILKSDFIQFKLTGKYKCTRSKRLFDSTIVASIDEGSIVLKQNGVIFYLANDIILEPDNFADNTCEVNDVVIGIDFHWEQKEVQSFQGSIKLKLVDDKIQLINILPIENYLYSVISSEMRGDSSLELLKSHAIISRSWLLAQIEKQKELVSSDIEYSLINETDDEYIRWYDREDHKEFHVCADDHCQRYQGTTRAYNPNVIKAIKATEGEVLMNGGKIADARFSKSCGGVTEKFENCWEPIDHPYLKDFPDLEKADLNYDLDFSKEENAKKFIEGSPKAFCNTTDDKILSQVLNDYDHSAKDFYRWNVEYTQKEVSELINKKSVYDFGEIQDLIPIERGTSSRLIRLKIVGSKLTKTIGKELEIRRILSDSHLYSSAFTVEKVKGANGEIEKFVLRGAGWGHGVGLCQIGAAVMGEKGYNYNDILAHYFRGAELNKLY